MTAAIDADPDAVAAPPLGDVAFARVRELIHRHAGIALNDGKRTMVRGRLARRLRALRLDSFDRYLDLLQGGPGASAEWQEFVNALTTNLTAFFREAHHFPVLARHLQQRRGAGTLRVWCCAASTGEEPYSIAMTAIDALGSSRPDVEVLATDIDTRVLGSARAGVYPHDAVARLDGAVLKRHFLRGRGANAGLVRVRPEVQALVAFDVLNLLAPSWTLPQPFDAIFCRNVMIYFDKATQLRVLHRLAAQLRPDGLLFVGHSENFAQARDLVELQGKTVYRLARTQRAAA